MTGLFLTGLSTAEQRALFDQAAEHHGLPNSFFAEKDYWAMRVLRSLVAPLEHDPNLRVIFKGGTSLSKGFGIIERFSEDIDVVLVPGTRPPKKGSKRDYLKPLTERVMRDVGCPPDAREDVGTSDTHYNSGIPFQPATPDLSGAPRVLLEMSVREEGSAFPEPSLLTIRPYAAGPLGSEASEYDDLAPFEVLVLPPVRTLIEKLCALIGIYETWSGGDPTALARGARHFYDVHRLLSDDQVVSDLERCDVSAICRMVRQITDANEYVTGDRPADGLAASPAFERHGEFADAARREYAKVQSMVYGAMPTYDDCLVSVSDHRSIL